MKLENLQCKSQKFSKWVLLCYEDELSSEYNTTFCTPGQISLVGSSHVAVQTDELNIPLWPSHLSPCCSLVHWGYWETCTLWGNVGNTTSSTLYYSLKFPICHVGVLILSRCQLWSSSCFYFLFPLMVSVFICSQYIMYKPNIHTTTYWTDFYSEGEKHSWDWCL